MEQTISIRHADLADLAALADVERAANERFAAIGLAAVAALTTPAHVLCSGIAAARLWVAVDPAGRIAGFALADIVGEDAHLAELDVDPAYGRQGIGSALVKHVCRWAASHDFGALTLVTFRDVPWNAPFYARLGFQIILDTELDDTLRELLQTDAAHGLPSAMRVVMRRRRSPADLPL